MASRCTEDLARALDRQVRLANDANCFALSEAADGAGAGAAVVFGVILGTGTRRRGRRRRPRADRPERDRRRVGPQRPAVARRGRVAGPALLLRPPRLHRDLPLGVRSTCPDPGAVEDRSPTVPGLTAR